MLSETDTPLSMSLYVCDTFISRYQVYAVIITDTSCLHKIDTSNATNLDQLSVVASIAFTCAFYNIPVMDLTTKSAELSEKVLR